MDVAQSAAYISAMTYEAGGALEYEPLPYTEEPLWILGKKYSLIHDRDEVDRDILSKLWFSYRKGFSAIGSVGPTSDSGWGCMLRCGQMMLGQALVNRHLGRDWQWNKDDPEAKYLNILRMFEDKKSACYSIHQIASMGVSEGKPVGSWFGPNTVAQVLRKLAVYDDWSSVTLHVAMDNTIIIDDILYLCKSFNHERRECTCDCSLGAASNYCDSHKCAMYNGYDLNVRERPKVQYSSSSQDKILKDSSSGDKNFSSPSERWHPLLLIIPLRLGLTEINSVYESSLKKCLSFRQSVGIIGGKPNHALWFIGFLGNELLHLDPHTTQLAVNLDESGSDLSYHCERPCRMNINQLDPSIALGFYCHSESDFNDLCQSIRKFVIHGEKTPMFELHKERPAHYPPFEPYCPTTSDTEFTLVERHYDTDEEFELL